MNSEADLLHSLALHALDPGRQARPAPPANVDWQAFYPLIVKEKMLPTLYPMLADLVPEPARAPFAREYERLRQRAIAVVAESAALQDLARARGLNVLFTKGAPFAQQHYGDALARKTFDIDMLIEPDAVGQFDELLRSRGYQLPVTRYVYPTLAADAPEHLCTVPIDYRDVGHVYHMLRPDYIRRSEGTVYSAEIKYFIRYVPNRGLYRFFTESADVEVAGHRLRTLSLPRSIVHFALDKFKDFVRGAQFSYRDLFDLVIVTRRHAADELWREVAQIAGEMGVEGELAAALNLPDAVLGLPPASRVLRDWLASRSEAAQLFDYLSVDAFFDQAENRSRYDRSFARAVLRWKASAGDPPRAGENIALPNTGDLPVACRFDRSSEQLRVVLQLPADYWMLAPRAVWFVTIYGSTAAPTLRFRVELEQNAGRLQIDTEGGPALVLEPASEARPGEWRVLAPAARVPAIEMAGRMWLVYSMRVDRPWYRTPQGGTVYSLFAAHERKRLLLS